MQLNSYIEHTLLKPTATPSEIRKLCAEAVQHQFFGVCVNGYYTATAKKALENSSVKVVSVIGFPLGAASLNSKVFEAEDSIKNGADEIDMVLNLGMLKSGNLKYVEEEISAIKTAIGNKILKVIIETCFLTDEEKQLACKAAIKANADFVKTSTGFGHGGATLEDVALMKEIVGKKIQIKASGGIKDRKTAEKYISLGASRLGTSSGVALVNKDQ